MFEIALALIAVFVAGFMVQRWVDKRRRLRLLNPLFIDGTRKAIIELVELELESAYQAHGDRPWSRHEFYGVLMEEVEEMWDEIKANGSTEDLYKELVQVMACCLRYTERGRG